MRANAETLNAAMASPNINRKVPVSTRTAKGTGFMCLAVRLFPSPRFRFQKSEVCEKRWGRDLRFVWI